VSDFLTRLVERTLGVADTARPDLASLASIVAAARVGHDDRRVDEGVSPPVALELSNAGNGSSAADDRRRGRALHPAVEESSGAPAVVRERAVLTPSSSLEAQGEMQRAAQPRALEQPFRTAPSAVSRLVDAPVRNATSAERTPPAVPVIVDRSARREVGAEANRQSLERQYAEPPTINITIGRIDVRSAPAASREHAPATPPAPRQLRSLETYLRERNGSRP
jgi:hypothetical protein